MLRYLYIPKNEDLDEHIEYAINNNFNQIIHGYSDIIKNKIIDQDSIQEINIPEHRFILNQHLVFAENERIDLNIIDEFNIDNRYSTLYIDVYKIDYNDMLKNIFMFSEPLTQKENFIYNISLSLELYGEYLINITYTDENNNKVTILTDTLIIYKVYVEKDEADDKFFFPG